MKTISRRVLSAPLHKLSEPNSRVLRKGAARPFSIGRISPRRSPSKKSEEFNRPPHSPAPISVQAVPGTPFCVTVDFDTRGEKGPELLDTVTLRHRDDDSQERVKISDLLGKLLPLVS